MQQLLKNFVLAMLVFYCAYEIHKRSKQYIKSQVKSECHRLRRQLKNVTLDVAEFKMLKRTNV